MSKISSTFLLHFIQKRFLNTVSTSTSPLPSVSIIQFLKDSCALASESPSPSSTHQRFQFNEKNIQKYEAVIGFLKSYGFENPQILKLVSMRPYILQSKVSTNLKPKFDFFQEIGFAGPLLCKLILSNPWILDRSLDSHLKPSFCFLREMLESDEQVTTAIFRSPRLLTSNIKGILKPNIDLLASEGVPSKNIAKLIVLQPRAVMQKFDRMVNALKMVKELGMEPKAHVFVHAVRVISSLSDSSLKKKINVLKSLGWSEEEIFTAFKRVPHLLTCSEEKMRDVADFCFNTAKLDPGTVISHPKLFRFALDKRLRPRYKVLEVLKLKNLLKNKKIAWLLLQEESSFMKNYVLKHLDEIPNLVDIYQGNVTVDTSSIL